jgi:hypothetical protein
MDYNSVQCLNCKTCRPSDFDRPAADNRAVRSIGSPKSFWLICDALHRRRVPYPPARHIARVCNIDCRFKMRLGLIEIYPARGALIVIRINHHEPMRILWRACVRDDVEIPRHTVDRCFTGRCVVHKVTAIDLIALSKELEISDTKSKRSIFIAFVTTTGHRPRRGEQKRLCEREKVFLSKLPCIRSKTVLLEIPEVTDMYYEVRRNNCTNR